MKIAVLGIGLMGFPMGRRLCEAGFDVQVWNRTSSKAQRLAQFGATVHSSALWWAAKRQVSRPRYQFSKHLGAPRMWASPARGKRDFSPRGRMSVQLKDLRNALSTANEVGFEAPITALFEALYAQGIDHGLGDLDYAGLFVELTSRNGMA